VSAVIQTSGLGKRYRRRGSGRRAGAAGPGRSGRYRSPFDKGNSILVPNLPGMTRDWILSTQNIGPAGRST
jgi:hypothetical protein